MKDFGVVVFPSPYSAAIRQSVSLLHYTPVIEPPMNYNFREEPDNDGSSQEGINNIPWQTDQQHIVTSPPKELLNERVGVQSERRARCSTIDEMEVVLDDLDRVLKCAEYTVNQHPRSVKKTDNSFNPNPSSAHQNNKKQFLHRISETSLSSNEKSQIKRHSLPSIISRLPQTTTELLRYGEPEKSNLHEHQKSLNDQMRQEARVL